MGKGRKKIPGEQRELMGDPSKGRAKIIKTENVFEEFSNIPPKMLQTDEELSAWDDLYDTLRGLSFLSEADKPTVGLLCGALADYVLARMLMSEQNDQQQRDANKFVYETDTSHGKMLRIHPLQKIVESSRREIHKCSEALSLTTLDRQNMYMKIMEYGGVGTSRAQSASPVEQETESLGLLPSGSAMGFGKSQIKH